MLKPSVITVQWCAVNLGRVVFSYAPGLGLLVRVAIETVVTLLQLNQKYLQSMRTE